MKALLLGISFLFLPCAALANEAPQRDAKESLAKLAEGNKHFVEGKLQQCQDTTATLREKLAKGQAPFAIVLSCSDSRVPPEDVFDGKPGDLFVVRVAGNVPDPVVLGSIEYAAEHLGSPLIVVLGHERCGAVTAAVDSSGHTPPEGNLGDVVKRISPAAKAAQESAKGADKGAVVERAIDINIDNVAAALVTQSKVIKKLVEENKLTIVKAKYDLDDGKVTFR